METLNHWHSYTEEATEAIKRGIDSFLLRRWVVEEREAAVLEFALAIEKLIRGELANRDWVWQPKEHESYKRHPDLRDLCQALYEFHPELAKENDTLVRLRQARNPIIHGAAASAETSDLWSFNSLFKEDVFPWVLEFYKTLGFDPRLVLRRGHYWAVLKHSDGEELFPPARAKVLMKAANRMIDRHRVEEAVDIAQNAMEILVRMWGSLQLKNDDRPQLPFLDYLIYWDTWYELNEGLEKRLNEERRRERKTQEETENETPADRLGAWSSAVVDIVGEYPGCTPNEDEDWGFLDKDRNDDGTMEYSLSRTVFPSYQSFEDYEEAKHYVSTRMYGAVVEVIGTLSPFQGPQEAQWLDEIEDKEDAIIQAVARFSQPSFHMLQIARESQAYDLAWHMGVGGLSVELNTFEESFLSFLDSRKEPVPEGFDEEAVRAAVYEVFPDFPAYYAITCRVHHSLGIQQ